MHGAELERRLECARRLAVEAGGILERYFRAPPERLAVDFKGPRDLVTRADESAEAHIIEGLLREFPCDAILSEEAGRLGAATPEAEQRVWIIDPLDGTTNFTHGHPLYAVSVGYSEGGEPALGVIHAPALGETYHGMRGAGAFLGERRLSVSPETELRHALLATGFSYSREELHVGALDAFSALLIKAREVRRGGSACLDLAHTAAGVFAGFWEYHLSPHDVCAGVLLVREAGGVVTDVTGGDDFLLGRSIVAAAPAIHGRLLEELRIGPPHPGSREDAPSDHQS